MQDREAAAFERALSTHASRKHEKLRKYMQVFPQFFILKESVKGTAQCNHTGSFANAQDDRKLAAPELYRVLAGIELIVKALSVQQFLMLSGFHDLPVTQDQDQIRVHDGGEPVGNDKAGLSPHQLVHGFLDQDLRAGVHVGGGLVQNQQPPVGQQGPCNGEKLLLTAGDADRDHADLGVEALPQAAQKMMLILPLSMS